MISNACRICVRQMLEMHPALAGHASSARWTVGRRSFAEQLV
ncbi:hypothetical protein [Phocaeicola sartorii]|nr:hypothetical protein [Phocaeicola sartorii]MCR1847130.1 hypothetical protein [Phocaeicola sartorii]